MNNDRSTDRIIQGTLKGVGFGYEESRERAANAIEIPSNSRLIAIRGSLLPWVQPSEIKKSYLLTSIRRVAENAPAVRVQK